VARGSGFSYVYRAEDVATGHLYALKRMTCADAATLKEALHEVEVRLSLSLCACSAAPVSVAPTHAG
jgi:hypothetical protein